MSNNKKATEVREEYKMLVDNLARETYEWAKRMGCYRDAESKEILGFFVIERRALKSPKPIWTESFDEDKDTWKDVVDRMIELGFPICADSFNGHYIGLPGEQGKKIGTAFNNVFTRTETIRKHVEASVFAGQWSAVEPYLQGNLKGELKEADVLSLLNGLEQLLLAADIPVQQSFAVLLLKSGDDEAA